MCTTAFIYYEKYVAGLQQHGEGFFYAILPLPNEPRELSAERLIQISFGLLHYNFWNGITWLSKDFDSLPEVYVIRGFDGDRFLFGTAEKLNFIFEPVSLKNSDFAEDLIRYDEYDNPIPQESKEGGSPTESSGS